MTSVALVALALASAASRPSVVGFDSLESHRISGKQIVEAAAADAATFTALQLRLTVAPDGRVTDVKLGANNSAKADPALAFAAARGWRFRPFTYRGQPVTANGTINIDYRPTPRWAKFNAPFPTIDYDHLTIELTRSGCFGRCPDYRVTIDGHGQTVFETRGKPLSPVAAVHRAFNANGVLVPGRHVGTIDRATLDGLIARFRAAHFFGLRPSYEAQMTDNPTYYLRFSTGGKSFAVTDYVGDYVGMPAVVTELEKAVDQAAGTDRWVGGNGQTVAALQREGFRVDGPGARALAVAAGDNGPASEAVVTDLIAAGLPLNASVSGNGAPKRLGSVLLADAIARGRLRIASALIDRGWLARTPRAALTEAFIEGGGGCNPRIARAVVAAGVSPRAQTPVIERDGNRQGGETALVKAIDLFGPCRRDYQGMADVTAIAAALLRLGADPNAVDADGKSALFFADDTVIDLLLGAGARVDLRARNATTALFAASVDAEARRLLDAGADPHGHDEKGKTLREVARANDMLATLAWLDAHRIP